MTTTDAVIYLSASRTIIQHSNYRSLQSLKKPFHNLMSVNDETLAAGASVKYPSTSLIIPLVGDVVTDQRISPGQIQVINTPSISNPYKEELVNYLLISTTGEPVIADFTLETNRLQQLTTSNHIHLGKFDGRRDGVHTLSREAKGVFVFILEGAFEVQSRLLHPRDGLALWNLTEVEFEALSNEAMLLLIEVH